MAIEITCMLMMAYIFIIAEWKIPFVHSKILRHFLENTFPKMIGVFIFIYVISKYILKLQ